MCIARHRRIAVERQTLHSSATGDHDRQVGRRPLPYRGKRLDRRRIGVGAAPAGALPQPYEAVAQDSQPPILWRRQRHGAGHFRQTAHFRRQNDGIAAIARLPRVIELTVARENLDAAPQR